MMKKLHILFFLMSCFLVAFSTCAQETPVLVTGETIGGITGQTIVDVKIDGQDFAQKSEQIQKIDVNFCENYGAKGVEYTYKLGSHQEVCFTVFNGSEQDVTLNIGFVDGMFTNDQWKNKACGQADDIDDFGKYITGFSTSIRLPKGASKTEYAKAYFPKDVSLSGSTIYGCLVYSLVSDDETARANSGIGIVVRKAKFIDLNIQKGPSLDRRSFLLIGILLGIGYRIYRKKMFPSKGK